VNDDLLKIRRLSNEEWIAATDEQRLAHILSGGALSVEQAREVFEQIEDDISFEQRYLLSYISAPVSTESPSEKITRPAIAKSSPVPKTHALSPQPLPTLLPVEDAWQWTEQAVSAEELVRLRISRLQEITQMQQALKQRLDELTRLQPKPPKIAKKLIPRQLHQQTCREVRNAAIAMADGRTLRRWTEVEGENALAHTIPGETLHTKLIAGSGLDWWGLPPTCTSLRDELRKMELPAVLLLNILVGAALQRPHLTAGIDELIRSLGWNPRSTSARQDMRRKVWRWLLIFDSMKVYGKRPGVYRDRLTKEVLNLTSADALIRLTGMRGPAQLAFDNSSPPLEVSWVAGPWLDRFRNNTQVLQFFGDINKLAAIPSGQPRGAWAQSIGLALNQLWRERAAKSKVSRAGDDNRLTIIFDPLFTRFELLNMFRAEPWIEDVLNSNNPQRAKDNWKGAIRILRHEAGVIGHYEELEPEVPAQRRLGWQMNWLHQKLDIRPKDEWMNAIAEVCKQAVKVGRALARKKSIRDSR
jgi:hypothetical protein